jgi:hypothetical protein
VRIRRRLKILPRPVPQKFNTFNTFNTFAKFAKFAKFARFAKFGNLVDRLRQQRERGTEEPRRGAGERSPSVDAIRSR